MSVIFFLNFLFLLLLLLNSLADTMYNMDGVDVMNNKNHAKLFMCIYIYIYLVSVYIYVKNVWEIYEKNNKFLKYWCLSVRSSLRLSHSNTRLQHIYICVDVIVWICVNMRILLLSFIFVSFPFISFFLCCFYYHFLPEMVLTWCWLGAR